MAKAENKVGINISLTLRERTPLYVKTVSEKVVRHSLA